MVAFDKRFWSKVETLGDCLEWVAYRNHDGYGQVKNNGSVIGAHRAIFIELYGAIPKKYVVMHLCDNPACVNPEHLCLGTQRDNIGDMFDKGRARKAYGTNCPSSKLVNSDIPTIRKMYADGHTKAEIAREYNIGWSAIHDIIIGKKWKHI